MVKEDIIQNWKQVDVQEINNLLNHFDIEKREFVGVELAKVSTVEGLNRDTYNTFDFGNRRQ